MLPRTYVKSNTITSENRYKKKITEFKASQDFSTQDFSTLVFVGYSRVFWSCASLRYSLVQDRDQRVD